MPLNERDPKRYTFVLSDVQLYDAQKAHRDSGNPQLADELGNLPPRGISLYKRPNREHYRQMHEGTNIHNIRVAINRGEL